MEPTNQTIGQTANQPTRPTRRRARFSIKSILVITAVFAAGAASLGHLWRAASGDKGEIGNFVVVTAMLPLVVLVVASWFFKISRRFIN
ncbi:MAG: hypothetical protein AB8B55_23835 [Mariniblastus sp.]